MNIGLGKKREYSLILIDKGYCTQSEAASLVGVSRQLMHRWVQEARPKIYPLQARDRHLRKLLHEVYSASA